jgi:ABC transporter
LATAYTPDGHPGPSRLCEVDLDVPTIGPAEPVLPEATIRDARGGAWFDDDNLAFDPVSGGGPLVAADVDRQARAFGVVSTAFHTQRSLRFVADLLSHPLGGGRAFLTSPADNIRYARPQATAQEVTQAASAALVTQFADDLPDDLNTRLAHGGTGLSGGQRQPVGIAHALLVDGPVVLLDEPTAGLATEAEQLAVHALTRFVHGRTVVMTTHRPALTRLAIRTIHLHNDAFRPTVTMPST